MNKIIISDNEFFTDLTGFETTEPIEFTESTCEDFQDFTEEGEEGTYYQEGEKTYYKVRCENGDCVVFDDDYDIWAF